MASTRQGLALALVACVTACTPSSRFVPASGVERATSRPTAGLVRRGGVTVVADAEAWTRHPALSEQGVIAIHVRILNDSGEPIAVRYPSFRLASELGDERRPLPPVPMQRARPTLSAVAPQLDAQGFRYAPYYQDLLGDAAVCWTGGMALDPYYYETYLRWHEDLPTETMVRHAVPEGVLEPGGWVAGFVYFEALGPEARRVTLEVDFDQPRGAERIATITIPFVGSRG